MLGLVVAAVLVGQAAAFWRLPCDSLVSTERLDPIVSPGSVSGHVHAIAGASALAPTVTYDQLRASECTSCYVKEDMSLYWTANLWVNWANGTVSPVPQVGGLLVYYLQRGDGNITAFPPGFRMLAGDPFLRTYTPTLEQRAITYTCLDYTRGNTYPQLQEIPAHGCADGLRAQVFFPSCWDGVNLDSADHKSHMAYPDGVDNGNCPTTHPVRLVSLFYETTFDTWSFESQKPQTANPSQPFVWSFGDATGYGHHGDFINGWDVGVLQSAIDTCTAASGVIEECDKFSFFAPNTQCKRSPYINELTTGLLPKLPGCNPITNTPTPGAPCPAASYINQTYVYNTTAPPRGAVVPGAPSIFPGSSGYTYTGCFADNGARTLATGLTDQAGGAPNMTPAKCLAACAAGNFTYCGLEYGQECWASNTIKAGVAQGQDGSCGKICNGDSSLYCGDASFLSLYTFNPSAPVSSAPSSVAAPAPAPATSTAPTVSRGGLAPPPSTTAAAAPAPATTSTAGLTGVAASIGPYQYLGCLIDQGPRTLATSLTQAATASGPLTPQSCIAQCAANKFQFCGFEYGQECWAANYLTNTSTAITNPNTCNKACAGDNTKICGAGSRLTTYQLPNWTPPIVQNPGPPGTKSLGCIVDNQNGVRVLRNQRLANSVATCIQQCAASNYPFAGVEYGGQCWCDTAPQGGAIAAPANDPFQAGCNMKCSGNATEACGGSDRLNLYQIALAAPTNAAAQPQRSGLTTSGRRRLAI